MILPNIQLKKDLMAAYKEDEVWGNIINDIAKHKNFEIREGLQYKIVIG